MIGLGTLWKSVEPYTLIVFLGVLGITHVAVGIHYFNKGVAAGNAEVAQLKAQYSASQQVAAANVRAEQARIDAQALLAANARAQAAEQQVSAAAAKADAAERSAHDYKVKIDALRKTDAAVNAWLDACLPVGVRAGGACGTR